MQYKAKMNKEKQLILKKLAAIIYEQFSKDLITGNLKYGICLENKQAVGKSAKKAKTFHQPALDYGK